MPAADKGPSEAINRAVSILEALSEHDEGLTNAQISGRLDIPKSSASYLLQTLERRGYLRRDAASGRYHLTLKILELGRSVLSGVAVHESALPVLHGLVERSQLTAHLAVLEQGKAVYVEKVDAPGFIKMDTWIGRRMDLHTTGVGKALVAFLPRAEAEALLRQQGLARRTSNTITSMGRLLQELERVRAHGDAVDDEENSLGVRCVAAPVFDALGEVQAAVGVSGTTTQISRANLSQVSEFVRDAARQISAKLGHRPARPHAAGAR